MRAVFTLLILLLLSLTTSPVRAEVSGLRADLEALAREPSRVIGSPGYEKTVDHLRKRFASIPQIEVREHAFDVMVPQTHRAVISIDGREVNVHPFWPASARLVATPVEGLSGRLVYAGRATPEELAPVLLRDSIVAVEANAGPAWQRAVDLGASAIVVLHDPNARNDHLRDFELRLPVNLPRVYLDDAVLIERLRRDRVIENVRLQVSADWRKARATNFYVLVPGRDVTDSPRRGAITFTVPFESSSHVPSLAPGASQAFNTAVAMDLLEQIASAGLSRPVLFLFTGADSIQMLGSRQAMLALADSPANWQDELSEQRVEFTRLTAQANRLDALDGSPEQLNPEQDLRLMERIIRILETERTLNRDQLFKLRLTTSADENATRRREELESLQEQLGRLRTMLLADPRQLANDPLRAVAATYLQRAREQIGSASADQSLLGTTTARIAELELRASLYQWLAGRVGRDPNPGPRDTRTRAIEAIIGIDLSDRGLRIGPMFQGAYTRINARRDVRDFVDYFTQLRRAAETGDASAAWYGPVASRFDLTTVTTSTTWSSFVANVPLPTEMAGAWGVPGLSLMTLDDPRSLRDTPNDRLDRLDLDSLSQQADAVRTLLANALRDPRFGTSVELRRQRASFQGQVVSAALGKPVPDLPRSGFLITYTHTANTAFPPVLQWSTVAIGIRRTEITTCDAAGQFRFEGMSSQPDNMHTQFVQAFRIEPGTGVITATGDMGKQAGEVRPFARLRDSTINPVRIIPFECAEVSLVGLYDPRYLQPLAEVHLLDARRNAVPQRYSLLAADRMLSAFVEPDGRFHLLLRYGRVGNRLLLLNMPLRDAPVPESMNPTTWAQVQKLGRGFTVEELRSLRSVALATTHDFVRLDAQRLDHYRRAGVSSALIDSIHADATEQSKLAQAHLEGTDGPALIRHANAAWSLEALVYRASQRMANDVIRAAIFLLLLAVPFSVCMERLMIASPNVYRQIAGTGAIFALMTAALWAFHPAFRISSSPLIIVLAFAILFMSVIVISVVYQKFVGELQMMRSGRGAVDTSFARSSVLTQAVMLGIANMRKRKLRTILTSVTIVLITFAVLVFASATSYRDVISLPTGLASAHPGVQLRQLGFRPLPVELIDELRAMLPAQPFVQRWWNVSAWDPEERHPVIAGGSDGAAPRIVQFSALLGLDAGEGALTAVGEVLGTDAFSRIDSGRDDVIFLPQPAATQLQVGVGDQVRLWGRSLEVAGIYNPAEFDRRVVSVAGEPITPLRYDTGQLDASGRRLGDVGADQLAMSAEAGAAEASTAYLHHSSADIAIIPASLSRVLPSARLASVTAATATFAEVDPLVRQIASRFSFVLHGAYESGVELVSVGSLAKISGTKVAVPLIIGGLIIFNTLMGSIAERKREIAIYTSLGLAPMHVGALFVAEALTYGVIGTVFGYIIGQGVGTLFQSLGWLGNLTLDYSGGSVLTTIGLILLVVLLSALVPARMASRLAAPSIERSWRVPEPVDGVIRATLPFTINHTAAEGAVAYLLEFFETHREGSIGKFAADSLAVERTVHDGRETRRLTGMIWLTPFDLGVRQHLTLDIRSSDIQDIYEVDIRLERRSGDDGSWHRLNRSFLTEVRKQFLQWRSLSPDRMRAYITSSRELFDQPQETAVG